MAVLKTPAATSQRQHITIDTNIENNSGNVPPTTVAVAHSPHSIMTHKSSTTVGRAAETSATLSYVMQPALCVYTQPSIAEENVTTYAVDTTSNTVDDLPLGADASSLASSTNHRNKHVHHPTITVVTSSTRTQPNTHSLVETESGMTVAGGGRSSVRNRLKLSGRASTASRYMAKEGWRYIIPANVTNAIAFEQERTSTQDGTSHGGHPVRVTGARSVIADYLNDTPGAVPPRDVSQMMQTVLAAASVAPLPTLKLWRENLVVLVSFLSMIMIEPIATSSGVFLTPLVNDLQVSYSQVSYALGLQSGGVYLFAPVTNYLNERFGFQLCAVISSCVSMLAFAGTAYWATTIWHFYIGYGFVGGVSLGVTLMSIFGGLGFVLPGKDGKMTFVITGIAVGNMVMPPLLDAIINQWKMPNVAGWRAGLYIISLLQVSLLLLCLIYKVPGERCCRGPKVFLEHGKKPATTLSLTAKKKPRCRLSFVPLVILNKRWLFLSISYFFWNFHRLFQIFAPHIVAIYYSGSYNTGVVITVWGASELIGRVMTIVLNSRPVVPTRWRYTLMSVCLLFCSACLGGAALLLELDPQQVQFEVWCIPIAAAGFLGGIIWNTYPWYLLNEFGPFHFAQVSDWMEVFAGIAALISVIVAGHLTELGTGGADRTGAQKWVYLVAPFYMASAGVLGSWVTFMVFTVISKRHVRELAIAKGGEEVIVIKADGKPVTTKPHVTIVESTRDKKNLIASLLSSRKTSPVKPLNDTDELPQREAITPTPGAVIAVPVLVQKKSSIFDKLSCRTNETRAISNKSSVVDVPVKTTKVENKVEKRNQSKVNPSQAMPPVLVGKENANETEKDHRPPVPARIHRSTSRSKPVFPAPPDERVNAEQQLPPSQIALDPVVVQTRQQSLRSSKSSVVEHRIAAVASNEQQLQNRLGSQPVLPAARYESAHDAATPVVKQTYQQSSLIDDIGQKAVNAEHTVPARASDRAQRPLSAVRAAAAPPRWDTSTVPEYKKEKFRARMPPTGANAAQRTKIAPPAVIPYAHVKRPRKRWSPVKGTRFQRQQMYGKQVEMQNRRRARKVKTEIAVIQNEPVVHDIVRNDDDKHENDTAMQRPINTIRQKDSVEKIENAVEQWNDERRRTPKSQQQLVPSAPPPPPPSPSRR